MQNMNRCLTVKGVRSREASSSDLATPTACLQSGLTWISADLFFGGHTHNLLEDKRSLPLPLSTSCDSQPNRNIKHKCTSYTHTQRNMYIIHTYKHLFYTLTNMHTFMCIASPPRSHIPTHHLRTQQRRSDQKHSHLAGATSHIPKGEAVRPRASFF